MQPSVIAPITNNKISVKLYINAKEKEFSDIIYPMNVQKNQKIYFPLLFNIYARINKTGNILLINFRIYCTTLLNIFNHTTMENIFSTKVTNFNKCLESNKPSIQFSPNIKKKINDSIVVSNNN